MKARKFNHILNECLERLFEGETIEQCLQSYPALASDLEPLLRCALAARKAAAIQPSAEFRARARYQFLAALNEARPKKGRQWFVSQTRWATVVTAIVILLLAGSGTVIAADNSMPGDSLYPLKLATEEVQVTLTPSAVGKAELYARFTDKRVAEIIYTASKGDTAKVNQVNQQLNADLAKIEVLVAAQKSKRQSLSAPAPAFAPTQTPATTPTPTPAPRPTPSPTHTPPSSVKAGGGKGPEDAATKANSQAQLKAILENHATNHQAQLREALDKVPDSVKPNLRKSIGISEEGYQRIFRAIERD